MNKSINANTAQKIEEQKFFSVMVKPINNLSEGREKGNFTDDYTAGLYIPLKIVDDIKLISFIPVTERMGEGREIEFLKKFGKKPLTNATNYFFGTLASPECQEATLPPELKGKDFVAVSTDESDICLRDGHSCFLRCYTWGGVRKLCSVGSEIDWNISFDWVLLAEDL